MLLISFFLACAPESAVKSTDSNRDSGWAGYGDSDTDSDADADTDTDEDSGNGDTGTAGDSGDTDTAPPPESACQTAMSGTNPAYPVYPTWDGAPFVNLTVTLTGAMRQYATVAWFGTNPNDWGWISCGEIIDGTTAVIRVEAMSFYDASTVSTTIDPGDGSAEDHNGFWWYPWSVTGGDLGGTQYTRQVDGEVVHLVAVTPPPAE